MREICTIQGQIWHIGERAPIPLYPTSGHSSYAFYDAKTGEVWGRRLVQQTNNHWVFVAREPKCMDMILPYEYDNELIPIGLACALIVGRGELLDPINTE